MSGRTKEEPDTQPPMNRVKKFIKRFRPPAGEVHERPGVGLLIEKKLKPQKKQAPKAHSLHSRKWGYD
jgi:hypothetical protein